MFTYRNSSRVFVWAHRGSSASEPENTIPAFMRAEQEGADGIECDLQLTRDGVVVVFHDPTLDRLTDARGWLWEYSWSELQALRVKPPRPDGIPAPIPRLEAVLEALGPDTALNLELKSGPRRQPELLARTLAAVRAYAAEGRVLLSSFDHPLLLQAAQQAPDIARAALYVGRLLVAGQVGESVGTHLIHLEAGHLTAEDVQTYHRQGLAIGVFGIRCQAQWQELAGWGVDAVFLDNPRWAVATP